MIKIFGKNKNFEAVEKEVNEFIEEKVRGGTEFHWDTCHDGLYFYFVLDYTPIQEEQELTEDLSMEIEQERFIEENKDLIEDFGDSGEVKEIEELQIYNMDTGYSLNQNFFDTHNTQQGMQIELPQVQLIKSNPPPKQQKLGFLNKYFGRFF